MNMKREPIALSDNFYLHEFTKSQTALRHGIDNEPKDGEIVSRLVTLANHICQPVRNHFNQAYSPNSGYRCEELEKVLCWESFQRWAIDHGYNGVEWGKAWKDYFARKQHPKGYAVDMEVPGISNYELACYIRDMLDFDQVILECYTPGIPYSGWVHASYISPEENRHEVLTWNGNHFLKGLYK